MPEKFFSKEKPQESESDSDKLVINSGAEEQCEQPEKPQVSESEADSNKPVINNDVQEKCEQPKKPQELESDSESDEEVREWPKEYRDKWKKNEPCSEGFNTHLWGFQGDRWENVHFESKPRHVTSQINCLGKMSHVLRVSTHIYAVSKEIDGKTFILRVNLGMCSSN